MKTSVFKTPGSRDSIRARYHEILSAFPFGPRTVQTGFGETFALEAGDPGCPALVLLHGSCSNSAFWFREISALSSQYRVLALDIIGEAGNSEETRPGLDGDGYADWLGETLDALGVETAAIAGNSLGGWVALKFAVKYPKRVSRLMLIASAGLSGINTDFLGKVNEDAAAKGVMTIDPVVSGGEALPKEVEEFINLILRGFNPITEELPLFSDAQLAALDMPLLYVAGDNDVLLDTAAAARRLGRLFPGADVRVLKGVGHMVMNAVDYMVPFLTKEG